MKDKKVLVVKHDLEGFLTIVGSVVQNKEPIMIMMMNDEKEYIDRKLISDLSDWLESKSYPRISPDMDFLKLCDSLEILGAPTFNSFPSDLHRVITKSSGVLIDFSNFHFDFMDCFEDWYWEDDDFFNAVFNLSDLPEGLKTRIDNLPEKIFDMSLSEKTKNKLKMAS